MDKKETSIIRETDQEACQLARKLMDEAQTASLGVLEPESGMPLVSRVAVMMDANGAPLVLASQLSAHSVALEADQRASLLLGEVGSKGDPLTHPRITLVGHMNRLSRDDESHGIRRENWLKRYPKAKLYIDFGDFHFYRLELERANLNGGFGKAYVLTPKDLLAPKDLSV